MIIELVITSSGLLSSYIFIKIGRKIQNRYTTCTLDEIDEEDMIEPLQIPCTV